MWVCNNGKPMKTKSGGWMNVLVTSSPDVSRLAKKGQMLTYIRLLAPEVAEMYNASATPVSLANWRVICNTGSLATQIGKIHDTAYYDQKLRRRIVDNNPVVQPGGHFYLVNDTQLFDDWYGNADNKWGSKADEQVPVFQMDEENWGVSYKIETAKLIPGHVYTIRLQNFNYDVSKDFRNETVKIIDEKNKNNPYGWNNVMVPARNRSNQGVQTSTKEFFFTYFGDMSKLKNAKLMILGLPASGGFVSLTLKNEYDQICARTVDYGRLEPEELGMSTEKIFLRLYELRNLIGIDVEFEEIAKSLLLRGEDILKALDRAIEITPNTRLATIFATLKGLTASGVGIVDYVRMSFAESLTILETRSRSAYASLSILIEVFISLTILLPIIILLVVLALFSFGGTLYQPSINPKLIVTLITFILVPFISLGLLIVVDSILSKVRP